MRMISQPRPLPPIDSSDIPLLDAETSFLGQMARFERNQFPFMIFGTDSFWERYPGLADERDHVMLIYGLHLHFSVGLIS